MPDQHSQRQLERARITADRARRAPAQRRLDLIAIAAGDQLDHVRLLSDQASEPGSD
jgi:hypothetical protein